MVTQWLTVNDAADAFPGKCSVRSLWRWMTDGKNGIRLPYVTVANRRMISAEAMEQFLRETATRDASLAEPLTHSLRARLAKMRLEATYFPRMEKRRATA